MKVMERLDVLENNLVLEVGSIGEVSNVIDLIEFEAKFFVLRAELIREVCGFESSSKSSLVAKVKMAVIKEANEDKKKKKKKVERIGMTKRTLEMIMKVCCRSDARKVCSGEDWSGQRDGEAIEASEAARPARRRGQ